MKLTITVEKKGNWFVGYVDEIEGINTQGRTLDEVLENLKEALRLIAGQRTSEEEANERATVK